MTPLKQDARLMLCLGVVLLIIALIGFSPRYIFPIFSGQYSMPSLWMHPHAALSTLWLLIFIAQPYLIGKNDYSLHKRFGYFAVIIAAANTATGIILQIDLLPAITDQQMLNDAGFRLFASTPNFIIYFVAALILRKKVSFHMRYMYFATIAPVEAAMNRILVYLLDISPAVAGPLIGLWHLLLIMVVLIYDKNQNGKVHAATWWGLGGFILIQIIAINIIGTSWWQQISV